MKGPIANVSCVVQEEMAVELVPAQDWDPSRPVTLMGCLVPFYMLSRIDPAQWERAHSIIQSLPAPPEPMVLPKITPDKAVPRELQQGRTAHLAKCSWTCLETWFVTSWKYMSTRKRLVNGPYRQWMQ